MNLYAVYKLNVSWIDATIDGLIAAAHTGPFVELVVAATPNRAKSLALQSSDMRNMDGYLEYIDLRYQTLRCDVDLAEGIIEIEGEDDPRLALIPFWQLPGEAEEVLNDRNRLMNMATSLLNDLQWNKPTPELGEIAFRLFCGIYDIVPESGDIPAYKLEHWLTMFHDFEIDDKAANHEQS